MTKTILNSDLAMERRGDKVYLFPYVVVEGEIKETTGVYGKVSFTDSELREMLAVLDRNLTAEEFKARWGYTPEDDDLERVNCQRHGELGHRYCGICHDCGRPRFECGGD